MRSALGAGGVLVMVLALVSTGTSPAVAAPGDLDPSFGDGGIVRTGPVFVGAVAVQPDGRIVGAGVARPTTSPFERDWGLVRYNPDGSIDLGFGTGGSVTTDFGGNFDWAGDLVLQPDGKIVVTGVEGDVSGAERDFAVARYQPDGALDASFGVGGMVTTDLGGTDDTRAMILQPDGKIVVGGQTANDLGLARYNPDGSLDPDFGQGGIVTDGIDGSQSADALFLQTDGKLLVAGNSGFDLLLARYNANGTLDPGFGTGGVITYDLGVDNLVYDGAVQPDGKIVVVGPMTPLDFALVRFHPDGSLDTGFGTGGLVTTDFYGDDDIPSAVEVQPDGRILAAGFAASAEGDDSFDEDYALARYQPDGSLDTGFGTGGLVATDIDGNNEGASGMALQSDGRIILAGADGLVRYLADGVAPPTIVVTGGRCQDSNQASGVVDLRVSLPAAQVSATSSNQELLPDANLEVSDTGPERRLRLAATPGRSGTATITVTAQGDGGTGSLTIGVVVGTPGAETLVGGHGPDVVFGLQGADMLDGLGGSDLLCGGNGDDQLDGGDGDDGLFGQNSSDWLTGGAGADHFSGGRGLDRLIDLDPAQGDTTDGS
jgi:uncharacterized delta-60 repeat protein